MQLKRLLFFLFCILFSLQFLFAQKWQAQTGVGAFYIPGNNNLNEVGKPKNVFGGFAPGWQLGAGLLYKFKPAWQLGPIVTYGVATKTNYQLKNLQLGAKLCYSPFYTWVKMQPYVFAFPFYSNAIINRDAYENRTEYVGSATGNDPGAFVKSVDYAYSKQQAGGSNYGIMPGFGVKGKLKGDVEYFVNLGYTISNLSSNSDIKEKYSESKGGFANINLFAGIGFNFGKKEKAAELIATSDTSNTIDTLGFLKRENFDLKKQFNLTGKMEKSKLVVYATTFIIIKDLNGKEIARTKVDTTGSFRFEKLQPDDYVILKSFKGNRVDAKYIVSQEDVQLVLTQGKLTNGELNGYLLDKLTNKPLTNFRIMLINNKTGAIYESVTDGEGKFSFTKLPSSDYSLVVGNKDKPILAKLYVFASDSIKMVTANDFKKYNFKKIAQDDTIKNFDKPIILGNILPLPADNSSLILVNAQGQVTNTATTVMDGYFAFTQMEESDYYIIPEYSIVDNTIQVNLRSYKSKILASEFLKYDYKKLSLDEEFAKKGGVMLVGKVMSDIVENSHLFLIDGAGKIAGNLVLGKDGYFIFRNLVPDDYLVVSQLQDPNIKVEARLMLATPELLVKGSEMFKYNYKTLKNEQLLVSDKFMLLGSIGSINGIPLDDDIAMFLLDADGNVVRKSMVDRNGNFSFSHVPVGNYQILPDREISDFKPTIEVYEDKSTMVRGEENFKSTFIKSSYYGPNEFMLKPFQKKYLDIIIKDLKANKNIKKIYLHGFGDMTGSHEYNLELTRKRTEEVRKYLVLKGANIELFQLNPMGRSMKYKNTQDMYDPTLNRRVDIEVVE
jgi:outer membrane protein OmpA-like peptidoglycan-associated protein